MRARSNLVMSDDLERLIDAHGLAAVLYALSNICAEKATHISASYSDETLARMWRGAGVRVANCAESRAVALVTP